MCAVPFCAADGRPKSRTRRNNGPKLGPNAPKKFLTAYLHFATTNRSKVRPLTRAQASHSMVETQYTLSHHGAGPPAQSFARQPLAVSAVACARIVLDAHERTHTDVRPLLNRH